MAPAARLRLSTGSCSSPPVARRRLAAIPGLPLCPAGAYTRGGLDKAKVKRTAPAGGGGGPGERRLVDGRRPGSSPRSILSRAAPQNCLDLFQRLSTILDGGRGDANAGESPKETT